MIARQHRQRCTRGLVVLALWLSFGVSAGQEESHTEWEKLHLTTTVVAGTTVHYEQALEPNLPIFEREFAGFLAERSKAMAVLDRRDEIIADINRILGAVDADTDKQSKAFVELAGMFSQFTPTLYLVRMPTIKDFLRAGGRLPGFTYDRTTDMASYNPRIHVKTGQAPPEDYDLCIPIATDKEFGEYMSIVLGMLEPFLGGGMVDVAIHEVTEMTLLLRARPTDPYWRWFSDGFADAITHALVKTYMGTEAAREFARTSDPSEYEDLDKQINLRYWMTGNFCVLATDIPVQAEARIAHARYACAMFEAQRLIDAHGMVCVRDILDAVAAGKSRTGSDLIAAIKQVTGEDMDSRLLRYQAFQTPREGGPKYARAFQAASQGNDYEQMYVNLMRAMELRGSSLSSEHLQMFKSAALLLFKMGHEKAGDRAMHNCIELYTDSPLERGREAALETFAIYALECDSPGKAKDAAEELLRIRSENVPALTVTMLTNLQGGDLAQAKQRAGRIQRLTAEQSSAYKMASRVLAIERNGPEGPEKTADSD